MSDDMLSQEEIEALLRGTVDNVKDEKANKGTSNIEDYLDSFAIDTLGEIGNISFGSSATALSSLLGQKVDITTPHISMINRSRLVEEFPHPYVAVQVKYTAGLIGMNLLVIKQSDAAVIADLMLGGDGIDPSPQLSEIQLSAVQEAMNQMMGSAATSMSTVFNKKVDISPPSIDILNLIEGEGEEAIPNDDLLIKISFRLRVGSLIDSNIMQLIPLEFGLSLVKSLLGESESEPEAAATVYEERVESNHASTPVPDYYEAPTIQPSVVPPVQQLGAPQHQTRQSNTPPVEVQQAQFASFEATNLTPNESRNLNLLLDIPLQVTVELGRTRRTVKEILELTSGSILELDKLAGEPVDILVNNRHIAKGEVVVIDENFGVRITDILSQAERINNLR
ncbi:flagellar motor switch phosphatase FliY [Psychrobacillus sp. MER TA 171]|uniref:flagellar motor switch phosphatase FliY n=1 Tax=Psychrobacillus sp. MER TA 171 TaxID=2939577 RepID=UPI00203E6BDD|nr:flagellar motor switch phosphatase FliY [Psychrobacillus sp. MER TA 171]MCM3356922.1 flagellar motor switch phosphatase FliY [Psychrobacillus sp. MER TA 171]